jgi:hypothetical protein
MSGNNVTARAKTRGDERLIASCRLAVAGLQSLEQKYQKDNGIHEDEIMLTIHAPLHRRMDRIVATRPATTQGAAAMLRAMVTHFEVNAPDSMDDYLDAFRAIADRIEAAG